MKNKDYYEEIKNKLIENEVYARVKDYSKERNKVITYFETGELLSKAGKEYGKNIIKQYASKLMNEVGKKYNERTLYRMRKFYEVFSNEKLTTMLSNLSWSHYLELLKIKDINKIQYYINICNSQHLTQRQLRYKIKSNEYDHLPDITKNKLIINEKLNVQDLVQNPIIIKSNVSDKITEYILKELILDNLDSFLSQLGDSFTYLANEYKIKLGDKYNYIDLLLYNIKYKCYVVVELKVIELKKEHTGQIQAYMNYIDKNIKTIDENKTVGIIICKKNNNYVIEYCSDERIIAREYKITT